jgi:hypothetical protein
MYVASKSVSRINRFCRSSPCHEDHAFLSFVASDSLRTMLYAGEMAFARSKGKEIGQRDLSEVSRQEEDESLRSIRFARLRKDSLGRNRSPVYVDCFNPGRKNEESRPVEE